MSELVCARFNAAPFYRLLGMTARSEGPGTSIVELPFGDRLVQLYGGIHGGALLSLADAAINVALATTFTGDETTATVELTMHFVAPAGTADLVATGRVFRSGRRLAFGECEIAGPGGEVARARGVCRIGRAGS
jgi:uncharacterized protein (TIGR00369 family)